MHRVGHRRDFANRETKTTDTGDIDTTASYLEIGGINFHDVCGNSEHFLPHHRRSPYNRATAEHRTTASKSPRAVRALARIAFEDRHIVKVQT